jgi:hypothetical protein
VEISHGSFSLPKTRRLHIYNLLLQVKQKVVRPDSWSREHDSGIVGSINEPLLGAPTFLSALGLRAEARWNLNSAARLSGAQSRLQAGAP